VATSREWVQGARPRTLGASVSPVIVGSVAGAMGHDLRWGRALAALVVAVALQVGVNYANDYSDGLRGTDAERKGPLRLTASGLAAPVSVRNAALVAFGIAAVVGAVLSIVVDWRLLFLGAFCLAAAVLYTGGPRPYGYAGLGELMVLVCFGFAATLGSAYVQYEHLTRTAWIASLVVGLPAVAILLANNIRDASTDAAARKQTLVVRIGVPRARGVFIGCIGGALVATTALALTHSVVWPALLAAVFAAGPIRLVATSSEPRKLVQALQLTARFQIVLALLVTVALWNA
jgi:1,4-dihydroxy-2-naphthoate octaprenyltransferase